MLTKHRVIITIIEKMIRFFINLLLVTQLTLSPGNTVACNDTMLKLLKDISSKMQYPGDLPANPASSCQQVYDLRSDAKSGYYWIQDGCCPAKVYCVMNNTECGGGIWTEIANVNMSIRSNVCPRGLEKLPHQSHAAKRMILGVQQPPSILMISHTRVYVEK